jgi:glycosyltransferase involved in cell wall biosynthesis
MSYRICDLEVTAALPHIELHGDESGLAVLVRRNGRPVWFWMEPLAPGTALAARELAQRISSQAGVKLLEASIREELTAGGDAGPRSSHNDTVVSPDRLTIAVCTRDRTERLARCLDSLPRDVHEILVIDNAPSDDRTRDLAASRAQVRYIREPKPGLDFARNRALREATSELLAFVDDDVIVDPEWLPGLIEAWRDNPDAAAVTGLILPLELETEAQIAFEQLGGFRGGTGNGFEKIRWGKALPGSAQYPCDAGAFGAGANMAFRRHVLAELGGFDNALDTGAPLPGGGDLDVFYRIIRAGHVIAYEPRCLVFHEHRRGRDALRRQYWSWGIGFMAFAAKSFRTDPSQRRHWGRLVAWWFMKYQTKRFLKALLGRPAPRADMVLAEIFGALGGLLGGYRRSLRRVERIHREFAT